MQMGCDRPLTWGCPRLRPLPMQMGVLHISRCLPQVSYGARAKFPDLQRSPSASKH